MAAAVDSDSSPETGRVARLIRAGLVTGVTDFLFSSVLVVLFYHSTLGRLWRGVASVPFGPRMLEGGRSAALIGVFLHFCTAFWWSFFFIFVVMRLTWVRRTLRSSFGVLEIASLYGPFIWVMMSFVVIPVFVHHAPTVNFRWCVQLFGHIPFVAVPIVAMSKGRVVRSHE